MADYGTVKYGSRGSEVSELQTLLNQNGYSLAVDGIFGDKTLAAVKQYQQTKGLAVDGIVGNNTWGALLGAGSGSGSTGGMYSPTGSPGYAAYADQYAGPRPGYLNSYSAGMPPYAPTQGFGDAAALLAQYEAGRPGAYESGYQAQIDALLEKIQNREPFAYDFNADPLYQQYKDSYLRMGRNAMLDTMGNAASLTGGYGSSYASAAGNQAYQNYMQQLNNMIPALQGSAYGMYRDQGADMVSRMGMLRGLEGDAYGRYRDTYGDWLNDRNYYYGKENDLYNREYSAYLNQLNQWNTDRDFEYRQYLDQYNQWAADRGFGYQSALDGQKQANWEMEAALAAQNQGSGGGSKAGGGGSSGSAQKAQPSNMVGNMTKSQLDEIALNIYRNTGMQDPFKRIQATGYTAEQKAYLSSVVQGLISSRGQK